MESLAQVDRIISEVNALEEKEKIIFLHKIGEIFDNSDEQRDEEVSIESVFGLWKDRDITKETLRKKAWNQILFGKAKPEERQHLLLFLICSIH